MDTSLLTHLRNQSKLYSMNSFLPTYYSQYIVLIEIFHWLGWHLAYSLIKLFHWQSEALHWQAAQELLLWKCWVRSKPMMQCSPLTCRYVKSFHNNDNFEVPFSTKWINLSYSYNRRVHWSVCLRSTFVTPSNEHSHTSCNLHCKRLCKMLTHLSIFTGCFFNWYPPKKLKYGKPGLGESTAT